MIGATVDLPWLYLKVSFSRGSRDNEVLKTATFKLEVKHFSGFQAISRETVRSKRMRKRVSPGVIFLHNVKPGWCEKIDLERLGQAGYEAMSMRSLYGGTETPTVNCV